LAPLSNSVQNVLDSLIARGVVGASAAIVRNGQLVALARAGLADRSRSMPVVATSLFKVGSCTKTFVAATLMRLAQSGSVDLNAPVSEWFADLPGGDRITVRHLLNHRSGLPEFEFHLPMTPDRSWTPREIVDLAFKVSPQNEPDRACSYSNTGYVLAGMLIEAITGDSLAAQVRKHVLNPLALNDTFSAAGEAFPEERVVRGYYHRPIPQEHENKRPEMWRMEGVLPYSDDLQDSQDAFPATAAFAAGDMISTSCDLARFLDGLFRCELFDSYWLGQMTEGRAPASFPGTRMRESGAGLFLSEYAGTGVFGHQGSIPGQVCVMQHIPQSGVSLALTTNTGSGDRGSFYAAGLHDTFDQLVKLVASMH
jgi:D-alanyl-D-alanine carboxypeptidase